MSDVVSLHQKCAERLGVPLSMFRPGRWSIHRTAGTGAPLLVKECGHCRRRFTRGATASETIRPAIAVFEDCPVCHRLVAFLKETH